MHAHMENSLFLSFSLSLLLFKTIMLASSTDEFALLAFRNAITSDPHGLLTKNWSTATSVCIWIGVTCDINSQTVTFLNISHFALGGAIPPHVGNLTSLRSLDVSFNNFTGTIPSELSNLRRLEEINVGYNDLGGDIPSGLGALSRLRRIILNNNTFSGGIPPSLFNISSLQILEMEHNSIGGDIPQVVGNLSYLQIFKLGYNQLTGSIPKGIFNAPSLVEIILIYNQLSNNIPSDICNNTPRLKVLHLSRNQLSGEIPANIWKCRELEILSLGRNNFNGSIPSEIGSLSKLKLLIMGFNHLKGSIPKQLGNLTSLDFIDLRENYLTGELPGELCDLPILKWFAVNSNNLSGSIPSSIFNKSTLGMLELSFNQFEGTLPSTMGISLSNLEALRLSRNRLSGPIPISITNASKLTTLEMNQNSFSGPMPDFGNLRLLKALRVWGNNLTGTDSPAQELKFFSSLTNCRYLEVLELSANPLNGILPAASIGNLSTSLLQFWARGCNINGVIPLEIGNLSSLLGLHLYENQMTGSIPSTMENLKNLQGLNLSFNHLQRGIPHHLCRLTSLVELDLRANMLTGPIPECLGEVQSLRKIYLSSNKLNSSIPSTFWDLRDLLILNLSSNSLSGNLPSQIGNLKAIYNMDISSNHFSGDIPSSFDGCQSLETLSLSNNMLRGYIPESLAIRCLKSLDLSSNNLSGFIPKSFEKLRFLEHFNVSYNSLDGEIPNEGPFVNFTAQSFAHNSALCGSARFQVPSCMKNHGRSISMVYVIPSLIIAIILMIIVCLLIKRRKDVKVPPPDDDSKLGVDWRVISYRELVQGTNGFSETNLLGRGGYGSVYKATLSDGLDVAVKVFNLELEGAGKSFDIETEILSSIRHRNLIRIIGCCTNADFRALVLQYMPHGSLEKWLYSDNYCLNLLDLLQIAVDVALALEYLHHGHKFPIVHCDIKPSNVLLDADMTAHVADFGISKLFDEEETLAQTKTLATIGYAAPEYGSEGKVSTKGDVYSYGIMLLEMFTRKKPTDDMFDGETRLKEWVSEALERNAINDVADPALHSTEDQECVSSVFDLAMKCLSISPKNRINMEEAAATLKKIKATAETNTKKTKAEVQLVQLRTPR
ncbi:hypothetical protein ACS0TY_028060 [Phlomoides rotata]